MKRFFTFTVAAALAACLCTTASSQTSSTSGSAAAGTTGTTTSEGTLTSGPAGVAGNAGTAGTAGTVGTAGTAGKAGTAGTAGTAGGVGTATAVGPQSNTATGINGRVNANAGVNNRAPAANFNGTFGNVSETPFFSDPGVRRQLNLNGTQYNTLNRAYQNAYTRYNQAVNAVNANRSLTEQQRAQQLQMLESQFNEGMMGAVNGVFTNPQSLARYNQLNRQFMGFNAFNDPAVRRQLNLTPEQVRQLRILSNNWRQQLQQFRRAAGNDLGSVNQEQWIQLQQQYAAQLNDVLTPDQQQLWSQQIGQPYSFPPSVFFEGQPPVVDPNLKYVPLSPQGTQPQTGTTQPVTPVTPGTQSATPGTTTPSTATQNTEPLGTSGGTVR